MSTADIAVIGVTVVGLANVAANWHVHMKALEKMGDRLRLVNPPKASAEPKAEAAPVPVAEPETTLIPGLERVV